MTARESWKIWYRALRVARRETLKACQDVIIYGTGVVEVAPGRQPRHIPFMEFSEPPPLDDPNLHVMRYGQFIDGLKL